MSFNILTNLISKLKVVTSYNHDKAFFQRVGDFMVRQGLAKPNTQLRIIDTIYYDDTKEGQPSVVSKVYNYTIKEPKLSKN